MPIYFLLLLLIPFEKNSIIAQSFFGLSIIKWVGFMAIFVALAQNAKLNRSPQLLQTKQGKFFILLTLLVFLNSLLMGQGFVLTKPVLSFISFPIFFFVTLSIVTTVSKVRFAAWAIVLCMFIASQYSLREYLYYTRVYGSGHQSHSTFLDANYYGLSVLIAIPLAYYLYKTCAQKMFRLMFAFILVLLPLTLILSLSRGAVVGFAGVILTSLLISRKKAKAFILLSFVMLVGLFFAPDTLWKRFEGTKIFNSEEDVNLQGAAASSQFRWFILSSGFRMIEDRPLTGVGLGNFKSLSTVYEPRLTRSFIAHNTYLSIAAELGLPALLFFLAIIAYTYRSLWRLRKILIDDPRLALLPNVLIVSLSGFVISATFLSAEYTKLFWLLIFLTIALERIVKEDKEREYNDILAVDAKKLGGHVVMDGAAGTDDSNIDSASDTSGTQAMPPRRPEGWAGGRD
jgi:O-antigen ligase